MPDPSVSFYDEIEAVLARTGRGRDFLLEHARRSRAADTQAMLDSIARLEARVGDRVPGDLDRLRSALADLADVIRTAKTGAGPDPIENILLGVRRAAAAASETVEKVQETAWNMRERGFDPALCDGLDSHATAIDAACGEVRASMAQLDPIGRSFPQIEARVAALRRVFGTGRPGHAPPLDDTPAVISNDDIDFVRVDSPADGDPPGIGAGRPADEDDDGLAADLEHLRSADPPETWRAST